MRAVCFVKRLEFELCGNVFPKALALGDLNNDGNCKLAVGNTCGNLTIFKGDQVWQTFSNLGMITAVAIGDVFNCGRNALIVVCGDGWCRILFDDQSRESPERDHRMLEVVHVQRIPANTKVVLLEDIDGDGCRELVLGLTDRVVRSYRWMRTDGEDDKPYSGKLVGLNKWECASQIGTVTLNHSADSSPSLLVAQPGGTLMKIHCHAPGKAETTEVESDELTSSSIDYHPLSLSRMRNPNVSTEIVGDIQPPEALRSSGYKGMRYAVATLDGTLMLVQDEEILWSFQVDHQLFALTKLSLTNGDGNGENIIACSWDGQTYILDQQKRSVRFQLEESVRAFCSGYYSLESNGPATPCLVYTTFTNKMYIYYDVKIPNMVARISEPQAYANSTRMRDQGDKRLTQQFTEWCLYGRRT